MLDRPPVCFDWNHIYNLMCITVQFCTSLAVSDFPLSVSYFYWKLQVLSVSMVAYIAGILTMVGSTLLVTTALSTLATLTPLALPTSGQHALLPALNQTDISNGPVTEERTPTAATPEDRAPQVDGSWRSLWTLLTLPSILSMSSSSHSGQTTGAKQSTHSRANLTDLEEEQGPSDNTPDSTNGRFFSLFKDFILLSFPKVPDSRSVFNQMTCAKGPCLYRGQNINCKNVSKPHNNRLINPVWTRMDLEHMDRAANDLRCKHCGARPMTASGRLDRFCDTKSIPVDGELDSWSGVSCCCDHVTADLDRGLVLNGLADISVGFRTMLTQIPLFGT